MIYNLSIKDDIFIQIVKSIASKNFSSFKDFSSCLAIVPNYRFAHQLKKSFLDAAVLPKIKTLDQIFYDFAVLSIQFDKTDFKTKSVASTYKILSKDYDQYSIDCVNRVFDCIHNKTNDAENFQFNTLKKYFANPAEYVNFKKTSIDYTLINCKNAVVAGFIPEDEIQIYLIEKATKLNHDVFFWGVPTYLQLNQDELFYNTHSLSSQDRIKNLQPIDQANAFDCLFFKNADDSHFDYTRSNCCILPCENNYQMLQTVENLLLDHCSDVALITEDKHFLQKLEYKMSLHNVVLNFTKNLEDHLDGLFLLYIIDLCIFWYDGKFLLQLIKHPYIYSSNAEIVDNIENNYVRQLKTEKKSFAITNLLTNTESQFLSSIKKMVFKLKNSANFAVDHAKCAKSLSCQFSWYGQRVLGLVSSFDFKTKSIIEYKAILSFFLKNNFCSFDHKEQHRDLKQIDVFKPSDCAFLTQKNIVIADFTESKFGLCGNRFAYSMFQILNTKNVFITYNKQKAISKTVLKMQGLPGIVIKDEQGKTNKNFAIISKHKSDFVLQEDFKISSDKIPKTLTATMIELLINDPWQFCLKYILKVKEINDIDKKPSYAEFGNLVHNTLQHCKLGTTSDAILTEIFDQYAKKYYQNFKYVKTLWFARFKKIAQSFATFHNERLEKIERIETECEYSYQIGDFVIKARIDRLEFLKDGGVSIIDFKTGVAPTIKSVEAFLKPQILVQGLVFLCQSVQQHVKELAFAKLSANQIKLVKLKNPESLIKQLETKIENLIRMHKNAIIQT